jgi:hypothetical protein
MNIITFTYFNLKLDETQNKTDGIISLLDRGVITQTVLFSFIAE